MTLPDRDVGDTGTKRAQTAPPHSHRVPLACELAGGDVRDCNPWGHWPLYGAPQEALEAICGEGKHTTSNGRPRSPQCAHLGRD